MIPTLKQDDLDLQIDTEQKSNSLCTPSPTPSADRSKLKNLDLTPVTPEAPKKKAEKLPPRPADYDYYWYQDEDGTWRNEYDDQGYQFADDEYDEEQADEIGNFHHRNGYKYTFSRIFFYDF